MTAAFVDLARLGAIGVSVICLILSFRWNAQITREAKALPKDRILLLTKHARSTMLFATVFLVVAFASEIVARRPPPASISLELRPPALDRAAEEIEVLRNIRNPVRVKVAGSQGDVAFEEGTGKATVSDGSTLSFDYDAIVDALRVQESIAIGERRVRNGEGGL